MAHDPSPEDMVFLSTIPAGPGQRRIALAVVVIAAVLFLIGLPFASVQLPEVWAFIPVYESWLIIIDAITAVFNSGRFDLGWYMGRTYGLAAVSFVLVMLLIENGRLYAKLVDGQAEL